MNNKNENKKTFADLLRSYETAVINNSNDYPSILQELGMAIAYSVLKKCINVSGSKKLNNLRTDIAKAKAQIENLSHLYDIEKYSEFNKNGDLVEKENSEVKYQIKRLISDTIGDGYDLVQTAILKILEETDKARKRNNGKLEVGFLEKEYTKQTLDKRVVIRENSANIKEVETMPVQEVYRTVRSGIGNFSAKLSNGYMYIEFTIETEDGVETAYKRTLKNADFGTETSGQNPIYTASEEVVSYIEKAIIEMKLSEKETEVLNLRLKGYGNKAIATYRGVKYNTVQKEFSRIQKKAEKYGLTKEKFETLEKRLSLKVPTAIF